MFSIDVTDQGGRLPHLEDDVAMLNGERRRDELNKPARGVQGGSQESFEGERSAGKGGMRLEQSEDRLL